MSTTRFNRYKCDACGATVEILDGQNPPSGWSAVRFSGVGGIIRHITPAQVSP